MNVIKTYTTNYQSLRVPYMFDIYFVPEELTFLTNQGVIFNNIQNGVASLWVHEVANIIKYIGNNIGLFVETNEVLNFFNIYVDEHHTYDTYCSANPEYHQYILHSSDTAGSQILQYLYNIAVSNIPTYQGILQFIPYTQFNPTQQQIESVQIVNDKTSTDTLNSSGVDIDSNISDNNTSDNEILVEAIKFEEEHTKKK